MNSVNSEDMIHLSWWVLVGVCKLDLEGREHLGSRGYCVILPLMLSMECIRSLVCIWFVFLVSICILPGIFCDKWDGWLIDWLMGSSLFLLDPAHPWPISSLSIFPCLGMACCFDGLRLRSKFSHTPGSFIPLDLACYLVWINIFCYNNYHLRLDIY